MYACNFFPDSKTAYHIQVAIDKILSEVDLETSNTPCTTDKGSNMVEATSTNYHINCACPLLSTAINTAWEAAIEESDELAVLDTSSNSVVKFVKKSSGIQYNLPAALKSGGKT